jgi:hypothetical protein
MRYSEILEACWKGYKQAGLKKKGGRQVPNCVPVQEATDIFLDNAARDMMAVLSMMAVGFGYGIYVKIRNKLDRYQGYQIVAALEDKGVTMNRETYLKVKPVLDQFKQALKNDDGAQAKELAKRIEQMVVMGKLAAPEPQAADTAVTAKERELEEDLRKWFKEKWVRFGPDGKIRGDCARGSSSEGKPKCLPQSKAHALGKKGRASAAAKKRREDPDPERRGPAKNVATKVREEDNKNFFTGSKFGDDQGNTFSVEKIIAFAKTNPRYFHKDFPLSKIKHDLSWWQGNKERMMNADTSYPLLVIQNDDGHLSVADGLNRMKKAVDVEKKNAIDVYLVPKKDIMQFAEKKAVAEEQLDEKQDACYNKVKSRYKVWPSAYASGALVRCRKVGANNWGNKSKK